MHRAVLAADDRVEEAADGVQRRCVSRGGPARPGRGGSGRSARRVSLRVARQPRRGPTGGALRRFGGRPELGLELRRGRRLGRALACAPARRAADERDWIQLGARRDLELGAQEVAELVEAVDGTDRVVEERGQLLVAAGLLQAAQEARETLRAGRGLLGEIPRLAEDGVRLDDRPLALLRGVAERGQRGGSGVRERAERPGRPGDRGSPGAELREHRRGLVREGLELGQRPAKLAEGPRELLKTLLERLAALGGRLGGGVRVVDEPGDLLAHDVLDQIEVDLAPVVLERQEALAGTGLPARDLLERRGRGDARGPRLRRLAVDVLLAEEGLRPDQT